MFQSRFDYIIPLANEVFRRRLDHDIGLNPVTVKEFTVGLERGHRADTETILAAGCQLGAARGEAAILVLRALPSFELASKILGSTRREIPVYVLRAFNRGQ